MLEIEAENGFLMEEDEDSDGDGTDDDGSECEGAKENGDKKQENGGEDETDEEDDGEEDEDSDEEENDMRLDESLNKIIANELDAENEDASDIDDETMLQMDKQLAIAFKLRQSERKTDNSKIDYKLKVLDLIQELFKTSVRLDLVNVSKTLRLCFKWEYFDHLTFSLVELDQTNAEHSIRESEETELKKYFPENTRIFPRTLQA